MNINAINNINYFKNLKDNKVEKDNSLTNSSQKSIELSKYHYPTSYYMSFQARVDKDLKSFYDRNISNMPQTFKTYVDSLREEEKNALSPIETQYKAFEYLEICDTPDDIKAIYPDEPLFKNLTTADNSKATKGIMYDMRVIKGDLEESGETILAGGEDLTVYLVKKIFLEGKTISEINESLDKDLNPIFQKEDKNYIGSSTLKALGIQLPKTEYINSLKYTKDGYSDRIAQKLSDRWKNLSKEEQEAFKESVIEGKKKSEEQLTTEEKEQRRLRKSEAQKERWAQMSPEDKTEYLLQMQKGSREQRIIMINAWNKCPDIRLALSKKLTAFNLNPIKSIYDSKSPKFRIAMIEFWQENSSFAEKIGTAIINSREEYETAKEAGEEDEFSKKVLAEQKRIISAFKEIKHQKMGQLMSGVKADIRELFPYAPQQFADLSSRFIAKINYSTKDMNMEDSNQDYINAISEALGIDSATLTDDEMKKIIDQHANRNSAVDKALKRVLLNHTGIDMDLLNGKIDNASVVARFAVIRELMNCAADDETKKNLLFEETFEFLPLICQNLKNNGLDFVVASDRYDLFGMKFTRQPNQENIDRYYEEYQTPLSDTEVKELTALVKERLIDLTRRRGLEEKITLGKDIKNVIKRLGPCARELVGTDPDLRNLAMCRILFNENIMPTLIKENELPISFQSYLKQ